MTTEVSNKVVRWLDDNERRKGITSADKGFGRGYFDYLASVKDPRHI